MKLLKLDIRIHLIYYVLTTTVCLQVCTSLNVVCDTPDCKKLADYYKKNMNEQAKPCTDFYDYACHGWGEQNQRPKHVALWNVNTLLKQITNQRLRGLLEDQRPNTQTHFQYSKALYKACMNLPYMPISDASTVKAVMAEVGNWPMFPTKKMESVNDPWWQIESQYINKAGESSLFSYNLSADIIQRNQITVLICQQYSPFGMLKLFTPFHPELKKNYKAFLTDVIKKVAPSSIEAKNFANVIDIDLDAVIKYREHMAQIGNKFVSNGTTKMRINEFQEWYNNQIHGQETAKINWLAMVRSFYKNSKDPSGMVVQPTTKIIVDMNYCLQLAEVLGKTRKQVLENHIHLYFAERHLKLDKQMEAKLEKSVSDGYPPTGRIRYEPERWEFCIDNHNLVITLAQMYIHSYFPMETKQEMHKLLTEEAHILRTLIAKSPWLDPKLKYKTLVKVDKINGQIGYPEWYTGGKRVIPHLRFDVPPTQPTLFYAGPVNRVGVSAAYLQWPVFFPNMPYPVKFGSIGSALAHELHHGFDNIGMWFDEFGIRRTLQQDTIDKLQNQWKCIEDQYHDYKSEELRKRHITKTYGLSTLNEDISDVMGLKIAYIRYKDELQNKNASCPILPGFEKLGCDKLFFIAFASMQCGASTASAEEKNLLGDTHSYNRIRVNGAVGNMKEFHQTFGCKPSDPIVPAKICDVWK